MRTSHSTTTPVLCLGIVLLTLGTAITHLLLNFLDSKFILNGFGYLLLLAALCGLIPPLAPHTAMTRFLLIGYTLLTILLWIVFGARNTLGYTNKINEVLLVVLLAIEAWRAR